MKRNPKRRDLHLAIGFLAFVLVGNLGAANLLPSAELQKAIAAADRARATPEGVGYQNAFNKIIHQMVPGALSDCIPQGVLLTRVPSFQCVVIIGKTGKPKWVIRDSRDSMASCFFAKLIGRSYPPPPADNWPVRFGTGTP